MAMTTSRAASTPSREDGTAPERKPLGSLFVGDGEYVVIHGGTFGPFFNIDVAHAWACDAFGRGSFSIARIEQPWAVPIEERHE